MRFLPILVKAYVKPAVRTRKAKLTLAWSQHSAGGTIPRSLRSQRRTWKNSKIMYTHPPPGARWPAQNQLWVTVRSAARAVQLLFLTSSFRLLQALSASPTIQVLVDLFCYANAPAMEPAIAHFTGEIESVNVKSVKWVGFQRRLEMIWISQIEERRDRKAISDPIETCSNQQVKDRFNQVVDQFPARGNMNRKQGRNECVDIQIHICQRCWDRRTVEKLCEDAQNFPNPATNLQKL